MKINELVEMAAESFSKVKMIYNSNFARRGMILSLPLHAFDRSVEGPRGEDVTEQYLMDTLQSFLKAYDNKVPAIVDVFRTVYDTQQPLQIVVKHPIDDTVVNIPCVIEPVKPNKFKFVIKTIMIKQEFHAYKNDIVIVV